MPADTWRHPATSRARTPAHHTDADIWLPLTTRPRRRGRRLIDRVRGGRGARAHWFVLDVNPGAVVSVLLLDHRNEIAPPHARWVPATVTADAVGQLEYPGLVADGYTALGGVIVRFDRGTVEQIADDLATMQAGAMPGEHPIVELRGDVAVVSEHDRGHRRGMVEVDRVYPNHSGRYGLGAYLWAWRALDN